MADFKVGDTVKIVRSNNKYVAELLGKYGVIVERKPNDSYYDVQLHNDKKIVLFTDEIELVIPEPPYNPEALHRWLST